MNKPYSQACENNKQPILAVLKEALKECHYVLEVGSGTGQHAVHFAAHLPHLQWQPADQAEYLAGIRAWCEEAALPNLLPPLELEVCSVWPVKRAEAVFSANTVHIMHWAQVQAFICELGKLLAPGGVFCLYGPFNYGGRYTSDSNADFDRWLKVRDPGSGIRDFEAICALAEAQGLSLKADHAMPANNRLLEFIRAS